MAIAHGRKSQACGRFPPEGEFRSVDAVDARIAARRGMRGGDVRAGEEPELHQTQGLVGGQVQTVDNAVLAAAQLGKRFGAFDTHLQYQL